MMTMTMCPLRRGLVRGGVGVVLVGLGQGLGQGVEVGMGSRFGLRVLGLDQEEEEEGQGRYLPLLYSRLLLKSFLTWGGEPLREELQRTLQKQSGVLHCKHRCYFDGAVECTSYIGR